MVFFLQILYIGDLHPSFQIITNCRDFDTLSTRTAPYCRWRGHLYRPWGLFTLKSSPSYIQMNISDENETRVSVFSKNKLLVFLHYLLGFVNQYKKIWYNIMWHWLINFTSKRNAIVTSNTLKQSGSWVHCLLSSKKIFALFSHNIYQFTQSSEYTSVISVNKTNQFMFKMELPYPWGTNRITAHYIHEFHPSEGTPHPHPPSIK